MMKSNFLKNDYTKIILGLLWGFGLACIFRTACNGRSCMIYKAPKQNDIIGHVYGHDEKCFKYNIHTVPCTDDAIL